jgi:translocation protein SEC72
MKLHKYEDAVKFYTKGIELAFARPPWQPAAICRDEIVILLSNRSAANLQLKQYEASLADAEAVVQLKKTWVKGHFRKCRALQAIGRLVEAKQAIELGLHFEPDDKECGLLLKEIQKAIEARKSS